MGRYLQQLVAAIEEYRLDHFAEGRTVVAILQSRQVTEPEARRYLVWLHPRIEQQIRFPNYLEPPPDEEELYADGRPDVEIGTTENGLRCGLMLRDRPRNILLMGDAGFGKTTTIRRIILGIDAIRSWLPVSVIVFDKKGGDYVDIPARCGDHWLNLSIHKGMRAGFNGPQMPPNVWINKICRLFAARMGLKAGEISMANMMRWLLGVLNKPGAEPLLWPSAGLLLEVAKAAPLTLWATKSQYEQSLIQSLEGFTHAGGPLVATRNGLDLIRDVVNQRRSVVLDCSAMDPTELRLFFIDTLFSAVIDNKIFHHEKIDRTGVVFVLDDADAEIGHQAAAAFTDGVSPIVKTLTEGREFGVMAILGGRWMGNVHPMILNSVQYHIVFRMPHQRSVTEAGRTLSLPPRAYGMVPVLPTGQALVRQAIGWPHTMLVTLDKLDPHRGGRPEYDSHPFVPDKRLHELPEVQQALEARIAEHRRGQRRRANQEALGLSPEARDLLFKASLKPYWPVARLYEKRPSPTTVKRIREELETGGYAAFEEPRVGSKNLLLIEVREAGWQLLGKPPVALRGRGSITHKHFANWIRMVGEKRGHEAVCEWVVPSTQHPTDCAWHLGNQREAFEVIVDCAANVAAHVKACFAGSEVTKLTIISPRKDKLAELRAGIMSERELVPFIERMSFEPISLYEKELWP